MRNIFKAFFRKKTPLPPTILKTPPKPLSSFYNEKNNNPLAKPKNPFSQLSNPLDFSNIKPLTINIKKKTTDLDKQKEKKIWWLEKWYLFRDTRLAAPLDAIAYSLKVGVHIIKRFIFMNKSLEKIHSRLQDHAYKIQRNHKIRRYFIPGVLTLTFFLIFLAL